MNKVVLFSSTLLLLMGFTSCGDAESVVDDLSDTLTDTLLTDDVVVDVMDDLPDLTVTIPELPATYVEQDLSEFGLGVKVRAPADAIINENALFTAAGEQKEIVVKNSADGPELHIWKSDKDIGQVTTDVRGNTMNVFQAFMSEDADGVIYYAKKNIDDSDVYNFIRIVDVNGETWHMKGEGHGNASLSKDEAMLLYAMSGSTN